jgi:hypothetical protein
MNPNQRCETIVVDKNGIKRLAPPAAGGGDGS